MTADLFWRFPLRYGLHRMISGKDGQHHNFKSPSQTPGPHGMLPPPPKYSMTVAFLVRDFYIQKPCAVGNSNGTKRYSFNILNIYIYIGSDDKHSPYIYITEHQSTPTRTSTQITGRDTSPHKHLTHLCHTWGNKKKKFSHQSEAANC